MTKNKKGFTIIEVVLVLAIAGLIFLMVFIALPALQRSQRNTRRRQDMARILSAFTDYQSNTGHMPKDAQQVSDFVKKYVMGINETDGGTNPKSNEWHAKQTKCYSEQFCDPDGSPYYIPLYYSAKPMHGVNGAPSSDDSAKDLKDILWSNPVTGINNYADKEGTHAITYRTNSKCGNTEGATNYDSGDSNITIEYVLEGGAIYCGDNQ